MALLKETLFKGISISDAYFRVCSLEMTKISMNFTVEICASKDNDAIIHKYYNCEYNIDGNNPIEQAYEHLKSLQEYDGCKDC